jgi:hypothetical protein
MYLGGIQYNTETFNGGSFQIGCYKETMTSPVTPETPFERFVLNEINVRHGVGHGNGCQEAEAK